MRKILLVIITLMVFIITGCTGKNVDELNGLAGKVYMANELTYARLSLSPRQDLQNMKIEIGEDFVLYFEDFTFDNIEAFKEIELTENNFDDCFGKFDFPEDAPLLEIDLRVNNLNAWKATERTQYEDYDGEIRISSNFFYLLEQKNGNLFLATGQEKSGHSIIVFVFKVEEYPEEMFYNHLQLAENVKKYELAERKRTEVSDEKYQYFYNPCTKIIVKLYITGKAEDIIKNYSLDSFGDKAKISIFKYSNMITLTFTYRDYTNEVNSFIDSLSKYSEVFKKIEMDYHRKYNISYIPRIEYYTSDYQSVDYSYEFHRLYISNDKDFPLNLMFNNYETFHEYIDEIILYYEKMKNPSNYENYIDYFHYLLNKYNQSYFDNYILVISDMVRKSSGSIDLSLNNVYLVDDTLYIIVRSYGTDAQTSDIQYSCFNIRLPKEYGNKINKIVTLD